MMMCLKDLLLYVILLPIPSASPLLIGLYWLAVVLSIRPCGYCIALFIIISLTTSSSSPFLAIESPQIPINPLRPLTSPLPDRSWLNGNGGRWWDPAIMGYHEISKQYIRPNTTLESVIPDDAESASTPSPAENGSELDKSKAWWSRLPWKRSAISPSKSQLAEAIPSPSVEAVQSGTTVVEPSTSSQLPSNYIDLRWADLGFILDLGFARTEEGMQWEVEDAKRAAEVERGFKGLRETILGTKGSGDTQTTGSRPGIHKGPVSGKGIGKVKVKQWSPWDAVSFIGTW